MDAAQLKIPATETKAYVPVTMDEASVSGVALDAVKPLPDFHVASWAALALYKRYNQR
ncbi:GL18229 [Drosophila persimilis]|uniref:GL18229 n=1 Tax=Drosophila persimilis TaxID=7234 RepID=B4H4H9_DROPE|nr:GL18229 [Drosophila persimilis]